jgi:hypothetical protein
MSHKTRFGEKKTKEAFFAEKKHREKFLVMRPSRSIIKRAKTKTIFKQRRLCFFCVRVKEEKYDKDEKFTLVHI